MHSLKHLYCNPRVSKKYLAADACAWARWDRRGLERGLVRRLALPKSSVPCSFKLLVFTWHVTAFAALTHCRFTWRVCVQRQSQQLTTASNLNPNPNGRAHVRFPTEGSRRLGASCLGWLNSKGLFAWGAAEASTPSSTAVTVSAHTPAM